MRVVFMGTPEFALPALESVHARHTVVAVYTQPDRPVGRGLELKPPPVKARALELGLPVFQPEKLSAPGEWEKLAALKPDVAVVVAYGQILRQNVLDLPRLGCVNIHSSLLPRWRGAAPIHWAILAGDAETGVTTQQMVLKLDAGAILEQVRTPIGPDESVQSLHDRLSVLGGQLIVTTLDGLEKGSLKPVAQDEAQVTLASKLDKNMERLDPQLPALELDRRVRALNPWPGTSIWLGIGGKKERLKVKKVKLHRNITGPVGKLFDQAGMLLLGTPSGALELLVTQWEGKKEGDASAFMNGLRGRGLSLPLPLESGPS